jgi:hypothetical protein
MIADIVQFSLAGVGLVVSLPIFFWLVGLFRGLHGAAAMTSGIALLGFGSMIRGFILLLIVGGIFGFVMAIVITP